MLRLIGLVVSIGLADSLNPTTLAPALYLASSERARPRLIQFTLGVLVVYFAGGALIALGPGQLLLSLVPKPDAEDRHVLEVVVGVAMVVAAALLWKRRESLAQRRMPTPKAQGKSSAILGATITAVELPTAFPYFAAIAAIVGSGLGPVRQLMLLLLFNLCFVLPLDRDGGGADPVRGSHDPSAQPRSHLPRAPLASRVERVAADRRGVRGPARRHGVRRTRTRTGRPVLSPLSSPDPPVSGARRRPNTVGSRPVGAYPARDERARRL